MKSSCLIWALAVLVSPAVGTAGEERTYDVIIRHGRILDGQGNPWIRADVALKHGRIARVGRVALREIDASGDYASPGWIDMMD